MTWVRAGTQKCNPRLPHRGQGHTAEETTALPGPAGSGGSDRRPGSELGWKATTENQTQASQHGRSAPSPVTLAGVLQTNSCSPVNREKQRLELGQAFRMQGFTCQFPAKTDSTREDGQLRAWVSTVHLGHRTDISPPSFSRAPPQQLHTPQE